MSLNCSFSVMHWDIILCLVSNERRKNALDNKAYSLIKSSMAMKISYYWYTLYSAFLVRDTTHSALQSLLPPVIGFNINPALIVHLLNSLGSILASTCHIKRQITFAFYRVPIYTPGWRAAMWIKCLVEWQKCEALTENSNNNTITIN